MTIPTIHAPIAHLAIPLTSVTRHPKNARTHDLPKLRASLRRNGQYRPIVVNQRDNLVLAGNGTHEAMELEGAEQVAVTWVDADDDLARRILAVDNRTGDLAGYDYPALAALLDSLVGDLEGTGYDEATLAEVHALAEKAAIDAAAATPDFVPALDHEQPRLDQRNPTTCPSCGFEWRIGPDGAVEPA